MLQVSYAGSKGTRLYTFYDANQAAPSSDASAPFGTHSTVQECDSSGNCNPVFDTSISNFASSGSSIYHSLQSRFEKRFSGGLYVPWLPTPGATPSTTPHPPTWVRPTIAGPAFFVRFLSGNAGILISTSVTDFVLSYLYELPFGNGKRSGGSIEGRG